MKSNTPALDEAIQEAKDKIQSYTLQASNAVNETQRHNFLAFAKEAKRGLRNLKRYA
jgi:hypothetical protein